MQKRTESYEKKTLMMMVSFDKRNVELAELIDKDFHHISFK